MPYEFTPGLQRALMRAMAWARQQGLGEIAPLQLFLGLVEDDEGRPSALLIDAGLDRAGLARALFEGPPPVDATEIVPLASLTRDVFARAQQMSRSESTEETLASEHVLLAILEHDPALRERL